MNSQSFIYVFILFNLITIFSTVLSQKPEINDQVNIRGDSSNETYTNVSIARQNKHTEDQEKSVIMKVKNQTTLSPTPSIVTKIYKTILNPLKQVMSAPKVNSVMRNIATCVVNGAVELISHYFPAPLIPMIAAAAGMMVPFEPVLMLRDKVPVTSYRRAFMTALNSFLGTFDKYNLNNIQDAYDPYMTQRFNRRMMNYGDSKVSVLPVTEITPPAENNKGHKKEFIFGLGKVFETLEKLRRQDLESVEEDPRQQQHKKKRNYPNIGSD